MNTAFIHTFSERADEDRQLESDYHLCLGYEQFSTMQTDINVR
jgi:hypothetical protein